MKKQTAVLVIHKYLYVNALYASQTLACNFYINILSQYQNIGTHAAGSVSTDFNSQIITVIDTLANMCDLFAHLTSFLTPGHVFLPNKWYIIFTICLDFKLNSSVGWLTGENYVMLILSYMERQFPRTIQPWEQNAGFHF